ncbi:MAG: fibronectin type III domain-containing protein, partial [Bacteroidales bacterium]
MKKNDSLLKLFIGFILLMIFNLAGYAQPVAPNPIFQSSGQDALLIKWTEVPDASSYKIETSLDSAVFTEFKVVDTTGYVHLVDGEYVELIGGLAENTTYYIRVTSFDGATEGGAAGVTAYTLSSELVVHLAFDSIQGDSAIVNVVNNDYDTGIHGQVEIVEPVTSGLTAP